MKSNENSKYGAEDKNCNKNIVKLTDVEKIYLYLNKFGDSIVMVTAFVENTDLNFQLDEDLFRKALAYLQKRHPFLRACLTKDTNLEVQIDNYNPLELDWSDESISYDELISQLEVFNCKQFDYDSKSYLARSKIASFIHSNGTKMFAFNLSMSMVLTDGINITVLIIELVNIINALLMNKECNEMQQVLEPVESLNYMVEKQQMIRWKQKLVIKLAMLLNGPISILPDEFRLENESGFKLSFFKVDKQLTSQILKIAKDRKIKITSYLTSVVYYALKVLYDENKAKFPKEYVCGLPVNMRMRYEPNMSFSDMRNHIGLTEVILKEKKLSGFTNIWEDSEYIHKKIQEAASLELGALFALSHNKAFLKDALQRLNKSPSIEKSCEKVNEEKHSDLTISNIGSFVWNKNLVEEGPFKIRENYFSDSLQSKPNALGGLIFHISFWDDEIMMQLSSNKSVINSKFVDRLVQLIDVQIRSSV